MIHTVSGYARHVCAPSELVSIQNERRVVLFQNGSPTRPIAEQRPGDVEGLIWSIFIQESHWERRLRDYCTPHWIGNSSLHPEVRQALGVETIFGCSFLIIDSAMDLIRQADAIATQQLLNGPEWRKEEAWALTREAFNRSASRW